MTRKPLLDLIPDILSHIRRHEDTLQYNLRLYRIIEGQIKKEIEDSMRKEILSPAALKRALQRIPSINIPKKANDKLSKVYAEPVSRVTVEKNDQILMDSITNISGLDGVMMSANRVLNATKMAAIEPFSQDGKQQFRVLAGHQFLPFSDDLINPMNMTVFIKLIGKTKKAHDDDRPYIQDSGLLITDESEIRQVDLFQLFSDKEIIIIDGDGSIRIDKMSDLGLTGKNPLGVIPQVYLNKSTHELVPFPDTSDIDVGVLIPKILADLNYAVQFQSHSLIWTKNADLGNQEAHPDTIIDLGDINDAGGVPEIGTIDPKVDISGTLSLVEFIMAGYFSSKGIKSAAMKSMMPGREASGIAKAMDEGDTSAELKVQIEYFKVVEQLLWEKIEILQRFWSSSNLVSEKKLFSRNFTKNFTIMYREIKVIESSQEKVVRIQAQRDLGVIDRRSIVKAFNPNFNDEQIDDVLSKVDKEKDESIQSLMDMSIDNTETNNEKSNSEPQQESTQPTNESTPSSDQGSSDIKSEALNGAQVKSLVEVSQLVNTGEISRDSGVNIIMIAFNLDAKQANSILGKKTNVNKTTENINTSPKELNKEPKGSPSSRDN